MPDTVITNNDQLRALLSRAFTQQVCSKKPGALSSMLLPAIDWVLSLVPHAFRDQVARRYSLDLADSVASIQNTHRWIVGWGIPVVVAADLTFFCWPIHETRLVPWVLALVLLPGLLFAWNTWWRLATPAEAKRMLSELDRATVLASMPMPADALILWTSARGLRRADVRMICVATARMERLDRTCREGFAKYPALSVPDLWLTHPSLRQQVMRVWGRLRSAFVSPIGARNRIQQELASSPALKSAMESARLEEHTAPACAEKRPAQRL